jgi:hypothetical protein
LTQNLRTTDHSNMSRTPILTVFCALMLSFWTCAQVVYPAEGMRGVSSSTVVNAPKETVWKTLTTVGNFDDKLISQNGNEATVEQKFKSLPMLSAIIIIVKAKVTPEEHIDFEMVKCERLKAFAGRYTLSAIDPKHTKVHLTMYIDPGLPVPRFLVNRFIEGKVKSRLKRIKTLVETGKAS